MEIPKNNAKIVAIIQARMGSSRLPGKILMPLAGKAALSHVVERLRYSTCLDEIMVATTTCPADSVVEEFCIQEKILCFRGSENDVLDRYYQAGKQLQAAHIVRITADCPLIDPVIVDEVVANHINGNYDYSGLAGEFPDGLDCSVFRFSALAEAWRCANLLSEREHVGPYLEKHPEKFKLGKYEKFQHLNHLRWTLDEPCDYEFLEKIFAHLYSPGKLFLSADVLNLLKHHPEYLEINAHIVRNEGYQKSLANDATI